MRPKRGDNTRYLRACNSDILCGDVYQAEYIDSERKDYIPEV